MLHKVTNQQVLIRPENSRFSSKHEKRIIPVDGKEFSYIRFRAIGCMEWPDSGPNGNWDGFPYQYFEDNKPGYGYKSFIGKRAHYEHNSAEGIRGSIGDLPDSFLNSFLWPEESYLSVTSNLRDKAIPGKIIRWSDLLSRKYDDIRQKILMAPNQRDGSIEVLMRIDRTLVKSGNLLPDVKAALERIIRTIDTGGRLSCSMGANVDYSDCSTCGNRSYFSEQYCDHIRSRKGSIQIVRANDVRDLLDKEILRPEWLKHTVVGSFDINEILNGIGNKGVAVRNVELNHGTSFFELSVVGRPAFLRGEQLEKVARQQTESKDEWLSRIRKELGDDTIMDIYDLLQKEGKISQGCEIS